jgi:hypothetical protein
LKVYEDRAVAKNTPLLEDKPKSIVSPDGRVKNLNEKTGNYVFATKKAKAPKTVVVVEELT